MHSKHPRISCLLNAHEVSVVMFHVLMPYISLTFLTAAGKPVFCDGCKSVEEQTLRMLQRTLVSSSLILTQGSPLILFNLITMFSARLFSFPPLDRDLKSFVKEVPIPKDAIGGVAHSVPCTRPI